MTSKAKKRKSDGVVSDVSLGKAVQYFKSCKSRPKIRGNTDLLSSLKKVESVALETGLPAEDIVTIVNVAASGILPESICTRLIKSLIPATVVPSEAVIRAISWMSTNIPSSKIQALLIRWIILIYDLLDTLKDLHALYGILFYFLDNEMMCRPVCHLLYLLTRKQDVKLFRVRILLRLQKQMGNQPYLQGLMSIYKIYYPHYIIFKRTCRVFFPKQDQAWHARIRAVVNQQRVEQPVGDMMNHLGLQEAKRLRKQEVVPSVHMAIVTGQPSDTPASLDDVNGFGHTVPFSQITSFKLLLQNFDRLELPCQMAAALKERNLQHVLLCYPDPSIAMRLSYWLDHVLCEEFLMDPSNDILKAEELLQQLIVFTDFLKESVPVCENFLVKYLHIWNGFDFRPLILRLITRFRLHPFKVLSDLVLEPLGKLFFSSSVYCKCQLLIMFTRLLYNLVTVELQRYRKCCQHQQRKYYQDVTSEEDTNNACVFTEEVEEFNPEETIFQYILYVNNLIETGLILEGDSPLLVHCMLDFYELLADLHLEYGMMFIILPPPFVVYLGLFSSSPTSLSRICHVCCRYRENFLLLKHANISQLSAWDQQYRISSLKKIHQFNVFILDFCNAIWRQMAFTKDEKQSIFNLISDSDLEDVPRDNYKEYFSLCRHPALTGFLLLYLKQCSEPERQDILSDFKKHRSGYLEFLAANNLLGLAEFIKKNVVGKSISEMVPCMSQESSGR